MTTTRRRFLKQSGLLAGSLALPNFAFSLGNILKDRYEPGIQLYTIRDQMAENPEKSLEKVAKIGYKLVEHATYSGTQKFYNRSVSEMNQLLKQNGLKMLSGHYDLGNSETPGTLLKDWKKAVEDADKIGMKYMVCPSLPSQQRKTVDGYKRIAEELNKAGEGCKQAGIQFCYHNHNFEFEKIDNQLPYQILLDETESDLVKMEMDIFWVAWAGYDPLVLFNQSPGRYPLWHVKDMKKANDSNPTTDGASAITEVGNGVINWPEIFAQADKAGMENFFVEQDITPEDPFPSIRSSLTYLKNNVL